MSKSLFLCGLGNPGARYLFTRHNVGYLCVDHIHERFGFERWVDFDSVVDYSKGIIDLHQIILIKPKQYMNNSGKSLIYFAKYFKIKTEDIVVIYDDVDIPLGSVRVRKSGSGGSHNGMRDILSSFGTHNIARIRIGVGPKPTGVDLKDYVLGRISNDEMDVLAKSFERISLFLPDMVLRGIDYVISRYSV